MRFDREKERGFTLIELMVVVMIIAVLIAIAIPSFLGFRRGAQDRAAQATVIAVEKLAHAVVIEFEEFPSTNDSVALFRSRETAFTWNEHGDASTGPKVVSVDEDNGRQEMNIAVLSDSGTCFFSRVVVGGATVHHKEVDSPDCDSHEFQDEPGTGW